MREGPVVDHGLEEKGDGVEKRMNETFLDGKTVIVFSLVEKRRGDIPTSEYSAAKVSGLEAGCSSLRSAAFPFSCPVAV